MLKKSGVIFISDLPLLTDPQLAVISEILRNTGLIIFGGQILPYVFGQIDKPKWIIVILALVFTGLFYFSSIYIVRNIKQL